MPESSVMWLQITAIFIVAVSFTASLTCGFFVQAKTIAAAGTLRLRVHARRQWQRTVAIAWVCLGIAFIGLFLTGEMQSLFLGSLFLLFGMLLYIADRTNVVDMRDKGLIVDGAFYAWNRFRGYRWDEGKVPALVLRFDRYTSRFGMASEQKDLIQALLQEQSQRAPNSGQPQGPPSSD